MCVYRSVALFVKQNVYRIYCKADVRAEFVFVLYYWNRLHKTWCNPFDRYVDSNLFTAIRLLNTRYILDCFT